VRLHRAPGGAAQPGLQPNVQSSEYRVDLPDTGPQAVKNTGLALAPVRDEGADVILRLGNRGPCVGQ
jgi:hypothetical protein